MVIEDQTDMYNAWIERDTTSTSSDVHGSNSRFAISTDNSWWNQKWEGTSPPCDDTIDMAKTETCNPDWIFLANGYWYSGYEEENLQALRSIPAKK